MYPNRHMRVAMIRLAQISILICMVHCSPSVREVDPMDGLKREGKLVILTRNAPTTYYLGGDGYQGFEYELALAFANHMNLEADFRVLDNTADILDAVNNNEGHIAAAGLTRTAVRAARYRFGPNYAQVEQQLICGRGQSIPKNLEDLKARSLVVVANSSYEERLRALRMENLDLTWTATHDAEAEQLMDQVQQGEIDCTVVDSLIVDINRRYYPELKVGFSLSKSEPLAWVVAPDYVDLLDEMDTWFAEREQQELLEHLREKYFDYVPHFDYVDLKVFSNRVSKRLPRFKETFQKAADRYDLSWTLLAAQAYQESHWDVNARSRTGVRGIMMLTLRTADHLGIKNRLDPTSSIIGGARYLAQIKRHLPETIQEPDRTWIALAAYNVGSGHVEDARKLAVEQGLDPDRWRDLRQVLPLLSQRRYYKKTRFGYARGREPVIYVQRIRNFHDLLVRQLGEANEAMAD